MQRNRGFTLVELLTTLAVAGVLVSVAVPSLALLMRVTRVSSASNELLASLLLTRSEAIKRGHRVVMCRSADGQTCAPAGTWAQGWIVFADLDGDGERAAAEHLLHVQPPSPGELHLSGTAAVAKYVSYAPNGTTKLVSGAFQAGTLTICSGPNGAVSGRQIVVNATGRPRTRTVQLDLCT